MAYRVTDTLLHESYPAQSPREVEAAIEWILSGQDLGDYDLSEIDAMLVLVNDGDIFVDSHHLGITITLEG